MVDKVDNGGQGQTAESVFVGSFEHSLDPKRRLTIPSDWRAQVRGPGSLYVLPAVDERCLSVLPVREMTRRLGSIGHHSIADRKAREFSRVLASRSDLLSWDSQGRIRIKDDMLDAVGIKESVVLLGNFWFFELWAPEVLKKSGVLEQANIEDAVRHVGF